MKRNEVKKKSVHTKTRHYHQTLVLKMANFLCLNDV